MKYSYDFNKKIEQSQPKFVIFTRNLAESLNVPFDITRCYDPTGRWTYSYDECVKYQEELKAKACITKGQMDTITKLANELEYNLSEYKLAEMRFAFASELIQKLIEEKENPNRKATTKQMKLIEKMQWCPDVLPRTITTFAEADEYIKHYEFRFQQWKATRLTEPTRQEVYRWCKRAGQDYIPELIASMTEEMARKYIECLVNESKMKDRISGTTQPWTRGNSDEKVVSNLAADDFRTAAENGMLTEAEKDVLHIYGMEDVRDREPNTDDEYNTMKSMLYNVAKYIGESVDEFEDVDTIDFETLTEVVRRARDIAMEQAGKRYREQRQAFEYIKNQLNRIVSESESEFTINRAAANWIMNEG